MPVSFWRAAMTVLLRDIVKPWAWVAVPAIGAALVLLFFALPAGSNEQSAAHAAAPRPPRRERAELSPAAPQFSSQLRPVHLGPEIEIDGNRRLGRVGRGDPRRRGRPQRGRAAA